MLMTADEKKDLLKRMAELDEIAKEVLAPHNSKDELVPVDLYLYWTLMEDKPTA
tara:strand:- start:739 stop:900 length:162 start_codon:yes stop_codon:yes gene_type:complete